MNKRTTFLLIALGVSATAMAQDEFDALRYSRLTTGGTARTQAIGGAAGSLGGDISSTHVNPAGLGFYKTSEVLITPGFYFRSNNLSYLGNSESDNKSGGQLANIGVVFGIPNRSSGSKFRNFTIALDYSRQADFNNRRFLKGNNTRTSYTDRWVEDMMPGGTPVSLDVANDDLVLGPSLAFRTFLIDPKFIDDDPAKGVDFYFSGINPTLAGGIDQSDLIKERGGLDEFSIGFAGNYNEQVYMGLSVNFPTINYERNRTFREEDKSGDNNNDFAWFEHTENLKTDAVGFNSKLGIIYSPMPSLRIGVNYHTPTWFSMRDASTARVEANTEGYPSNNPGYHSLSSEELTDYLPVEYEYTLRTPSRFGGSVSYIFGTNADVKQQHGFITADVEYVNYSGTQFKYNKGGAADREMAKRLNDVISDTYKGAMNIRVGGELKFNVLAVRAGFSYNGNPYNSDFTDIDGSIKRVSGGLGYRNKGFFADLTYVHTLDTESVYAPYTLKSGPYPAPTAIGSMSGGNVVATIGLKF